MKKNIAITILSFALFNLVFSQSNSKIGPKSFAFSALIRDSLPEIILPPFSLSDASKLDLNDSKNGSVPKYARKVATSINLNNAGSWSELPGGRVWRVKVTSAGALGVIPLFNNLYLPIGATLHLYMPEKEEVLGAFTNINTPEPRGFCCGLVHGESCIIEYYEPESKKGQGILSIDYIGHAYRWVEPLNLNKDSRSGSASCEVNVACAEGNAWRDQIRSVVRVDIVDNIGMAFCSGTLVNNVRMDCTPYILSAQHCTEHGVTALEYSQWNFDFNYQEPTCGSTLSVNPQTMHGCKKVADSEDSAGAKGSDFLLLQLNNIPDSAFKVFYSGWDHSSNIPQSGVGIHHPQGDVKKISVYTAPAISASWAHIVSDTHWQIIWVATTSGHGISEPGSSGSPMYNSSKLVVGHLTGGNSCCVDGACSIPGGPDSPDLFGKLNFDWTQNGVAKAVQLQPWLDPDNTGAITLTGMNPPCGGTLQNDAGILTIPAPKNVCQPTDTFQVVLENFGDNTLTSVKINYSFDNGTVAFFTWHGSLYPGGTITLNLPPVTLSYGPHTITALTSNPNGQPDSNPNNDAATASINISTANALNLFLSTDDAGSETTWQITDASSTVVAKGGPYPDFIGGELFNIPLCLPQACYTFTINDAGGNGIHQGENGNFILNAASGSPVYATLSNNFFSTESHSFCLVSAGIEEVNAVQVRVVPNPSSGIFNLQFDNSEEKTVRVFDALGRLITESKITDRNLAINLASKGPGVYILQIESISGTAVKKLVLR